jgi:alkyl sulfatase BDS1-like metallo-beta-lactamase superfamily hydrolase
LTTNVIRAHVTPEELLGISNQKSSPSPVDKAEFWEARNIKANAFLKLGELAENPNWRNWYITAAHELKGLPFLENIVGGLISPGVQGGLPAGAWVNSLSLRLKAEITAAARVNKSLGFWFPADGNQQFGALGYVLKIRNGIAEFIEQTPHGKPLTLQDVEKSDLAISIDKRALDALLIIESKIIANRKLSEPEKKAEFEKWLKWAVDSNLIMPLVKTNLSDFAAVFFGYFDPKPVGLPPLTVR